MALNSFLASASSALAPESAPPNPSIKASAAMDRLALAVLIPGEISVVIFWFSLVFIVVSFPLFSWLFPFCSFHQLDLTRPSRLIEPRFEPFRCELLEVDTFEKCFVTSAQIVKPRLTGQRVYETV